MLGHRVREHIQYRLSVTELSRWVSTMRLPGRPAHLGSMACLVLLSVSHSMTGTPASASVLALAACIVLPGAWLIPGPAWAQEVMASGDSAVDIAHFEIPAQPLAEALKSFERLTHLSVLARSSVLDGKAS